MALIDTVTPGARTVVYTSTEVQDFITSTLGADTLEKIKAATTVQRFDIPTFSDAAGYHAAVAELDKIRLSVRSGEIFNASSSALTHIAESAGVNHNRDVSVSDILGNLNCGELQDGLMLTIAAALTESTKRTRTQSVQDAQRGIESRAAALSTEAESNLALLLQVLRPLMMLREQEAYSGAEGMERLRRHLARHREYLFDMDYSLLGPITVTLQRTDKGLKELTAALRKLNGTSFETIKVAAVSKACHNVSASTVVHNNSPVQASAVYDSYVSAWVEGDAIQFNCNTNTGRGEMQDASGVHSSQVTTNITSEATALLRMLLG